MYKRNSIKKLGRTSSHRKALKQNQLRSILSSGKVKTSSVKAKVLRGELESLLNTIKVGKDGDLSVTRKLNEILGDTVLVKKCIEMGKKDSTKVTIKKVGFRSGDNTEMSIVEISGFKKKAVSKKKVEGDEDEKKVKVVETKKEEEVKKGILNLGKKTVSKKIEPIKKERARSRSGL